MSDDEDFYPATAGDDPIYLGGVEYITKKRSDDLVKERSDEERERCAQVAESFGCCHVPQEIAAAIRNGEGSDAKP